MRNEELIDRVSQRTYTSLENFINSLYEQERIPIAVFDDSAQMVAISRNTQHCKYAYFELGQKLNCYLLFSLEITSRLLKGTELEYVCKCHSRLSTKAVEINRKKYTLVIFQYNLKADKLLQSEQDKLDSEEISSEKSERGTDVNLDLNWEPVVISLKERAELFDFTIQQCENFLS